MRYLRLLLFLLIGAGGAILVTPSIAPVEAQFGFGKGRMPKASIPQPCTNNRRGQIYYDTDDDTFFGCNGTSYVALDSQGATVASDLTAGTADFILQGDDFFVAFGAANDFQIEWLNTTLNARLTSVGSMTLRTAATYILSNVDSTKNFQAMIDTAGSNFMEFTNTVTQIDGGETSFMRFIATTGIMDGSDTITILDIDITSADHTLGSNILTAIDISNITGDAETAEAAINIGTGWDQAFVSLIDGSLALPAISIGELDDGFLAIGANNLGVTMNGALVMDWEDTNLAGASANLATLSATLGIFNGSDTFNALSIELTNVNHTGTTNVLNAIDIAAITGDADATEIGIEIGTGWDSAILLPQVNNDDTPSIAFGDGDTGFYEAGDDDLRVAIGGVPVIGIVSTSVTSRTTSGFFLDITASTATNPAHAFNTDNDTGMGRAAANELTLIAGAVEQVRVTVNGPQTKSVLQAALPAATDGTFLYCSDCNPDATCTGAGAGAFAFRIASAWACELN